MNKNLLVILSLVLIVIASATTYASIHSTVNITHVTTYPSGRAEITMEPFGPCAFGLALLGDPVNPEMLAVALAAQTTGKQVRMRIDGNGESCSIGYITIQPQ